MVLIQYDKAVASFVIAIFLVTAVPTLSFRKPLHSPGLEFFKLAYQGRILAEGMQLTVRLKSGNLQGLENVLFEHPNKLRRELGETTYYQADGTACAPMLRPRPKKLCAPFRR